MTNGICCEEGEQNIDNKCASIPLDDCLRAEFNEELHGKNICSKCTATTHVLVDGQCCAAATSDYINKSGSCASFPTGCVSIDEVTKECNECNSTHYLHPIDKFCCPHKEVHMDDGSCKALTSSDFDSVSYIANLRNSATECLEFDRDTKECLKCKDTFTFNGKVCQATADLLKNCNKID